MMKIQTIKVGVYRTNCYLVIENDHVIIIDPGSRATKILTEIEGLKVDAILLTHGHLDHIGAVDEIVKVKHCPVYCHIYDKEMLTDPLLNCSKNNNITATSKVIAIDEGRLIIGNYVIDVFHTPGHTNGSVVYQIQDCLFTGDTLFKNSVGRTDLPTGSAKQLKQSLQLIITLDDNLKVYPGHEEKTTIKTELVNNPFLNKT